MPKRHQKAKKKKQDRPSWPEELIKFKTIWEKCKGFCDQISKPTRSFLEQCPQDVRAEFTAWWLDNVREEPIDTDHFLQIVSIAYYSWDNLEKEQEELHLILRTARREMMQAVVHRGELSSTHCEDLLHMERELNIILARGRWPHTHQD